MKKVFVSMMLAGSLLFGAGAYAQTQTDGSTGATQKAQQESVKKEGAKEGKGKGDKKGGKQGFKGGNQRYNPFDGIQLTDDQQQRLQTLQQGLGSVVLDKDQQAKIKENPNLTPEEKKQLQEERNNARLESKKNYLNGVKEILTPDQYVVFLENFYLYSPQQNNGRNLKSPRPGGPAGQHIQKGSTERKESKGENK